jgi:uncharacterized protein (TIGR01244 family)
MKWTDVSSGISVADGQPARAELATLAEQGFAAVVNLREEGEADERMLTTRRARPCARGMSYLHVPFSLPDPASASAAVDDFRREMSGLPGRVLVHCGSGRGAAALTAIHLGLKEGLRGEEVLAMARDWGWALEPPPLADFVSSYVEQPRPLQESRARDLVTGGPAADCSARFEHGTRAARPPVDLDERASRPTRAAPVHGRAPNRHTALDVKQLIAVRKDVAARGVRAVGALRYHLHISNLHRVRDPWPSPPPG